MLHLDSADTELNMHKTPTQGTKKTKHSCKSVPRKDHTQQIMPGAQPGRQTQQTICIKAQERVIMWKRVKTMRTRWWWWCCYTGGGLLQPVGLYKKPNQVGRKSTGQYCTIQQSPGHEPTRLTHDTHCLTPS